MKFSLNHIRYYQQKYNWSGDPAPQGVTALTEKIGAQLGGVEEVIEVGKRYEGVVVAKIMTCQDHPNADRLHICKIDDGGVIQDLERDEQGYVQVVCGAPNARAGLLVAWLPPGSTVPSTFDADPFVLEARKLRGTMSNGMLASPRELGLSDEHEGILEIDDSSIQPGIYFADVFNLRDDVVIDIENKMFTHRPDCFGMMGVAREIAGIQQQKFTSPDWYRPDVSITAAEGPLKVEVENELPELVPRFSVIPMSNVTVRPSPVWLQTYLSRLGIRPINNIVDITNYFMILTGQPLHAYDYDKVVAQDSGAVHATLRIRFPEADEKLKLLNGKEIEPRDKAIMIATRDKLIGVAGVMGGSETEVDADTKNIILECANFDMYSIRRTSMAHGLFTDAVTRFNKGQSPLQTLAVLGRVINDVQEIAGGKVAGPLVDDNHLPPETLERAAVNPAVLVTSDFINARLGLDLPAEDIKKLLENVEFRVKLNDDNLQITAPFWRTDIEIPEDIVEEVGRLFGYDRLPLQLPKREIAPAPRNFMFDLRARIGAILSKAGANEVLTYSFVHGDLLDKACQDRDSAFKISNALSPDLQYYRPSLTPSLLDKVHANIKAGHSQFALFEIGKAHVTNEPDPYEPTVPKEVNALSLVFAADDKTAKNYVGAPYYQVKKYLTELIDKFGAYFNFQFELLEGADLYKNPWITQMTAPFEPRRSAVLRDSRGLIWGVVGEFKSSVRRHLKLPAFSAGFEIDPLLLTYVSPHSKYRPLSRFPKVEQDICLRVASEISYQELHNLIFQQLAAKKPKHSDFSLQPLDIYRRADDDSHKQMTFRITIASHERTLTDDEVNHLLNDIADFAQISLAATRV